MAADTLKPQCSLVVTCVPSRVWSQEEKAQQRLENLREMRRRDELDVMQSKREDEEKARMQHDRVKRGEEAYKKKKKATNDKYRKDARKADFGTRPGEEASAFVGTY